MPDEVETEVKDRVVIAGQEYTISPLRLKHLREISELVAKPAPTAAYQNLARFFPYIVASIKEKAPEFSESLLDEATLDEVSNAWTMILEFSGIKIVSKQGETKPAVDPSLGKSMAA
jgi:hypothetical protein